MVLPARLSVDWGTAKEKKNLPLAGAFFAHPQPRARVANQMTLPTIDNSINLARKYAWMVSNGVESNSVCNHTSDNKIGRPRSGSPI